MATVIKEIEVDVAPGGADDASVTASLNNINNSTSSSISVQSAVTAMGPSTNKPPWELIKEQLGNGEIPEVVREYFRMVPPESPEGRAFHERILEDIVKVVDPDFDIDKEPVKFVLLDSPDPNACVIVGSEPPVIGFTTAYFEGKHPICPRSQDSRIATLLHETGHVWQRRNLISQDANCTKLEETVCNVFAMRTMQEKGFAVREVYKDFVKMAEWRSKNKPNEEFTWLRRLDMIRDPHLVDQSNISFFQVELTRIERQEGENGVEPTPISEHDRLTAISSYARHLSRVDKACQEEGYDSLDTSGKLDLLRNILKEDLSDQRLNLQRVYDISDRLKKLEFNPEDIQEQAAIDNFANQVLEVMRAPQEVVYDVHERTPFAVASFLYITLSHQLHPINKDEYSAKTEDGSTQELFPIDRIALGEFRELAEDIGQLVAASDLETAIAVANRVVRSLKADPLFQTMAGRRFLRKIMWPSFKFPNSEGDTVSWNTHVGWCQQLDKGNALVEALLMVGVEDQRLYELLSPEQSVSYLNRLQEVVNSHWPEQKDKYLGISVLQPERITTRLDRKVNKATTQTGELDIHGIAVDKDGTVVKKPEDPKVSRAVCLDNWRERIKCFTSDQVQSYLMEEASSRDEELANLNLVKQCQRETKYRVIVADSSLEEDPQLFFKLNADIIIGNQEHEEAVLKRIETLIVRNRDLALTAIRELYGLNAKEGERSSGLRKTASTKNDYTETPLGKFVLENKDKIFTPIEQAALLIANSYRNTAFDFYMNPDRKGFERGLKILGDNLKSCSGSPATNLHELAAQVRAIKKEFDVIATGIRASDQQEFFGVIMSTEGMRLVQARDCSLAEVTDYVSTIEDVFPDGQDSQIWKACFAGGFGGGLSSSLREQLERARDFDPDPRVAVQQWFNLRRIDRVFDFQTNRVQMRDVPLLPRTAESTDLMHIISSVEAISNSQERFELLSTLVRAGHVFHPQVKDRLWKLWSKTATEVLGRDDGSEGFSDKVLELVGRIKDDLVPVDRKPVFDLLAKSITAQYSLASEIEKQLPQLDEECYKIAGIGGIAGEALLSAIRHSEEARQAFLDFLTEPISITSKRKLIRKLSQIKNVPKEDLAKLLNDNTAELVFENYWSMPLEVRGFLLKELLVPVSDDGSQNVEKAFTYVVNKLFPLNRPYSRKIRRYAEAYLKSIPEHQRPVLLSIMMAATERTYGGKRRIGQILRTIADEGRAETRIAQAAQSNIDVHEEIRSDLAGSKTKAAEESRHKVLSIAEQALEDHPLKDQLDSVQPYGEVLGSGTYYIVVEVNIKGREKPAALVLLRPHAESSARTGFKYVLGMLDELGDDPAVGPFCDLVEQAAEDTSIETDTSAVVARYEKAPAAYNLSVEHTDGEVVDVFVPKVLDYGEEFILLDKVEGQHFIDMAEDQSIPVDEIKRYAKTLLITQLSNILSGRVFCDELHGGNNKITRKGERVFGSKSETLQIQSNAEIGIFDLGTMLYKEPTKDELILLATVLYESMQGGKQDYKAFSRRFVNELKRLRAESDGSSEGSVPTILRRVQKTLLTSSDFFQHLDADDMDDVLKVVSRRMHPVVRNTFLKRILGSIFRGQPIPFSLGGLFFRSRTKIKRAA